MFMHVCIPVCEYLRMPSVFMQNHFACRPSEAIEAEMIHVSMYAGVFVCACICLQCNAKSSGEVFCAIVGVIAFYGASIITHNGNPAIIHAYMHIKTTPSLWLCVCVSAVCAIECVVKWSAEVLEWHNNQQESVKYAKSCLFENCHKERIHQHQGSK